MTTRDIDDVNENSNNRADYTRGLRHGRAAAAYGRQGIDYPEGHLIANALRSSAYVAGYARGYHQTRLTYRAN